MSVKVRAICNWTDSTGLNQRIMEQSLWKESDGIQFVNDDSYAWVRKYAEEYTIYSKIKSHIQNEKGIS